MNSSINIEYDNIEGIPETKTFETLEILYSKTFKDADLPFFKKRFQENTDLLSVLAFFNNELIGFKIGYRYNENTFYSWVGGVLETHRKVGVGMQLASLQENWVKQKGYKILRTKSMNCFKPMIILNLKNSFNITNVYINNKGQTKIVFEKEII